MSPAHHTQNASQYPQIERPGKRPPELVHTAATEQLLQSLVEQSKGRNAILQDMVLRVVQRSKETIQTWRSALQTAENWRNPNREQLGRVYNELLLDDDVATSIRNRKDFVLNMIEEGNFRIFDGQAVDEALTARMHQEGWLATFASYVLDSVLEGTSVIGLDLDAGTNGLILAKLPFAYIQPVTGEIMVNGTIVGNRVSYRTGEYADWFVSVGDNPYDLGLLNAVAPYALRKKLSYNLWAVYQELYTIPITVGKTAGYNADRKKEFEQALANMSTAMYLVLDQDESIEALGQSRAVGTDQVFDAMIRSNSDGIKKILVGQTMTSDDGSSKSQAEVHAGIFDGIVKSDVYRVKRAFNKELLPRLARLGYPIRPTHHGEIYLHDYLQPNQMQQVQFKISREWIEQKYNIKLDDVQPELLAAQNARALAIADIQARVAEGRSSVAAATNLLRMQFAMDEAEAASYLDGITPNNSAANFLAGQQQ
jgi:hypothetical protein